MQRAEMGSAASGRYVLNLAAKSARGQVAAINSLLEQHGAYIEEFAVFDDVLSDRFYVRTLFRLAEVETERLVSLNGQYGGLVASMDSAQGAIHDLQRP